MLSIQRSLAAAALSTIAIAAFGQPAQSVESIVIPGAPLKSFDIGYTSHGIYALADRSNASVDLIDTKTHRFEGSVWGFSGAHASDTAGPNGIVMTGNSLWAGDGLSDVKLVDLSSRRIVATVSTGGKKRVDELAYDPRDNLIVAANNADDPPFISFISTKPPYVVKNKLALPQATDGIEQPVWEARTQKILLAIPVLDGHKNDGGIAVIDPATATLERVIHVSKCMPAGLAAGPDGQLLVGCSDDAIKAGFAAKSLLIDAHTGNEIAEFPQVGGSDEVWYDADSGRYALAAVANPGGPVLGIIDAHTKHWVGNVPTGKSAHSVAAEEQQYFAPVAAGDANCPRGCVKIIRQ